LNFILGVDEEELRVDVGWQVVKLMTGVFLPELTTVIGRKFDSMFTLL